jgi:hypothetical protein
MHTVGVQQTTVGSSVETSSSRAWLDKPPAGTQWAPAWQPASKAVQKPRNGPNENGNRIRSRAPTRAPPYTAFQHSSIHCQLSFVSSHRNGRPEVADVWL